MKETQYSSIAVLTTREAQILTKVSESSDIIWSDLLKFDPTSGHIQEDCDLVQDLLDRNLLTSPDPMVSFNYRCVLRITPAGTAALSADHETRAAHHRDTIVKVIGLIVSATSLVLSAVSVAVHCFP